MIYLNELGTPILFVSVVLMCLLWDRFEQWVRDRRNR